MVRTRKVYSGHTLVRVLFPVGICMLFVAVNVQLCHEHRGFDTATVIYGLFHSYDSQDDGLIALILLGFMVAATIAGVICYKKRFYKTIKFYILLNSVAVLIVYALFHFRNVARVQSLPLSLPTAFFFILNFGSFGVISLHWKCSKRAQQFYLIMLSAFTAIFLINNLPDWTVWIGLTGLSIWDIFAVMTPCGPLKMLVETAIRRGDDNFPATLYSSSSYPGTPETSRSTNTEMTTFPSTSTSMAPASLVTSPLTPRRQREVREVEGTIRLGLGDFVFYSVMLGNTIQTSPLLTSIACFISNLVGLTITLPIVTLAQTPIPALPFPLACAAVFYFSSHIALMPFTNFCTTGLIMF